MNLKQLFEEKYEKTASPDFSPGVQEKGMKALIKKKPELAKQLAGAKKASVDAAKDDFLNGKTAAKAFRAELRKLNEKDAATLKQAALREDPFFKALQGVE